MPDTRPPVVVITGGSSGIGRGAAALFARRGWSVGVIARGEAGLRASCDDVEACGAAAASAVADVVDAVALEAAATRIEHQLGPIDVWINCAGNGTFGRFLDTPADEFRRVTDVTYLGTVNGTRVALQRMLPRDHGSIVNVCSAVALHGMPLLSSYSGAKHAVRGFGQSIQFELLEDGSKVSLTTVLPPAVNTPFFDHAVSHMGHIGRPMAPVYQPETVAEAIFLAAMTPRRELSISFTTVGFALGLRLFPSLVIRAIRRLGYGGQLTDGAESLKRHHPTLFEPGDQASPVRGAYDALARSSSLHVALLCFFARRRGAAGPTTALAIGGRAVVVADILRQTDADAPEAPEAPVVDPLKVEVVLGG